MKWVDVLGKLGACREAVEWTEGQPSYAAAWRVCKRADWMLWLLRKTDGDRISSRTRLCMCACARTALKYVPDGERRPLAAIECAERYARGEATEDELAAARDAAFDAAWAGANSGAWDAAMAAMAAMAASAAATEAASDAAFDAAWAGANSAARDAALKQMADLVREIVPRSPELFYLPDEGETT